MTYLTKNKARTTHTKTLTGEPASQYSRYETGVITGNYRDMPAIIADSAFDSVNDSERWQVMNLFDGSGSYLDTVAIGGAMDADHAMQVVSTQLDSIGAAYAKPVILDLGLQFDSASGNSDSLEDWSLDAIGKLMNNPSQDKHYLPVITAKELDIESHRVTFDSVQWGGSDSAALTSHGGKDSNLYLDMVRHDSRHDLVNALDINNELQALGAEEEESFDALMEVKSRLPLLKDRLFNAMSRSSIDDLAVTNVTETKPFKRQGVSNIAFIFDLSDGQNVSIWFHNPDSTPAKLLPSDIMISWKWMLNKRDVTAVLSPKNGDNVQLPTLAKRIMRVAAKNSNRFKSAQARKIQVDEELNQAQKDIEEKTAIITGLDEKIESLNKRIEDATKAPEPAVTHVETGVGDSSMDINTSKLHAIIDEIKSRPDSWIKDALKNFKDYSVWNQSEGFIKNLSAIDFINVSNALYESGAKSEDALFRAKRTGKKDLINAADKLMRLSNPPPRVKVFETPEQIAEQRDALLESINQYFTTDYDKSLAELARDNNVGNNESTEDATKAPEPTSQKKTKTYPPIERGDSGSYIAYMNNKKNDSWQVIPNSDGGFTVYADNASTRAGSGRGIPKVFDSIEELTARYPAFIGLDQLMLEDATREENPNSANNQDMSAAEIDAIELEAWKAFTISDDFWNKPTSVIQALSDDDFNRLLESLEGISKVATPSDDTDYRSETALFKAKRTGNATLIEDAKAALSVSDSQFSELPEAKKERDELAAKIDEVLSRDTPAPSAKNTDVDIDALFNTRMDGSTTKSTKYSRSTSGDAWSYQREKNDRENLVISATKKALDEGLFYLDEIKNRVAELLSVTQADRDYKADVGDKNGDFGRDVYKAKDYIETQAEIDENQAAKSRLKIKTGGSIGVIQPNNTGLTKAVVAVKVNDSDVSLSGKLGRNNVSFTMTYKDLEKSINRAIADGNRGSGVSDKGAASKRVIEGKTNNAKTPKGTKIASKFALVDAKYVIASHNATGSKNPKYPHELQPRDRGRETSIAWVQKTAKELDPESLGRTSRVDTGAPIVGDDLVVESGNGRTMAIKLAYKEGNAEEYREWLMENGDMFGFTANQVAKFKEPILVRIRTSEISREEFAIEANQDDKLSFTASELAKSDAKRITDNMLELFTPNDNGDLLSASNQPFIKSFLGSLGATEAAQYTDSNGQPTQALAARMKAAVFSKAYDDDRLLEMMADQTNPELQNMINALSMAAGKFVEAQANNRSQTLDISDGIVSAVEQSLNDKVKSAIVDASNILSNAKRSNQDVAEYVTQLGLFEDINPATAELAVFLANNSRSAKKMAEYFKAMAGFIDYQAKHSQTLDMFGEPEPLSLSDVMNHAKVVTSGNDLFSEDKMPAEQPKPIENEPNTTFSERISKIESIVNGGDFDPADVSTDELEQIAIAVKDDAKLIERVETITKNYMKVMARLAIAGMNQLAGDM